MPREPEQREGPSEPASGPDDGPILVGWREWVALPAFGIGAIKAKADTGARTCAMHAESLERHSVGGTPKVGFRVYPFRGDRVTMLQRDDVPVTWGRGDRRETLQQTRFIAPTDMDRSVCLTALHARAGVDTIAREVGVPSIVRDWNSASKQWWRDGSRVDRRDLAYEIRGALLERSPLCPVGSARSVHGWTGGTDRVGAAGVLRSSWIVYER